MKAPLRVLGMCLAALGLVAWSGTCAEPKARVHVILWFDTEDYLLPADDDACLRLARLLSERHIRATFKVVGEKARVLQRRKRNDVISALEKHDIGYHANFHSVHPTPSEYEADCGLLDGMAEFIRREGPGAVDVRRVFQVKTLACYGQPGSSWASQAIAALSEIGVAPHGVPCYVDEGDHVGLEEKPFWYAGALNVYHMGQNYTRMELHDPAAVKPAEQKVSAIVGRLLSENGGGLVSIFYHPCEWVHQEFWDGVNFRRGQNPPREEWKAPPQRTAEETDAAFKRFEEYIDYIRHLPEVDFVTASDLPEIYPDPVRTVGISETELAALAAGILSRKDGKLDFQVRGDRAVSCSDQFELMTLAVGRLTAGQKLEFPIKSAGLLGPDEAPPHSEKLRVGWAAFRDTTADVLNFIRTQHRVPSRVFFGADPVSPADYLVALAGVYDSWVRNRQLPVGEAVAIEAGTELLPAGHIADDTPGIFGGWVIHKEGFRAPKILDIARLQAWTLKPAIRAE